MRTDHDAMSVRIEPCRRGGYTISYEEAYDTVIDRLEACDAEIMTETKHLTVARVDGIKVSIKDAEISVKSDERDDAELVRDRLFDQD